MKSIISMHFDHDFIRIDFSRVGQSAELQIHMQIQVCNSTGGLQNTLVRQFLHRRSAFDYNPPINKLRCQCLRGAYDDILGKIYTLHPRQEADTGIRIC